MHMYDILGSSAGMPMAGCLLHGGYCILTAACKGDMDATGGCALCCPEHALVCEEI